MEGEKLKNRQVLYFFIGGFITTFLLSINIITAILYLSDFKKTTIFISLFLLYNVIFIISIYLNIKVFQYNKNFRFIFFAGSVGIILISLINFLINPRFNTSIVYQLKVLLLIPYLNDFLVEFNSINPIISIMYLTPLPYLFFIAGLNREYLLTNRKKKKNELVNIFSEKAKSKVVDESIEKIYLGLSQIGKKIYMPFQMLRQHVFILGTVGAGKTYTLMLFVEHAIRYKIPCVIIDGKGSLSFIEDIKKLCNKMNKNLIVWNGFDDYFYNPFSRGGQTELADKIMSLFDFEKAYFKTMAKEYVQGVIRYMIISGDKIDLFNIAINFNLTNFRKKVDLLYKKMIKHTEQYSVSDTEAMLLFTGSLAAIDENVIEGLRANLNTLITSDFGYNLKYNKDNKKLDLIDEIINNNSIVLFSINGIKYHEYVRTIGKLVINDIRSVVARKMELNNYEPFMIILDELGVYIDENLVDLNNKCREQNGQVIMGTQSLADIDKVSISLREQIIQNSNTHIAMLSNEKKDLEIMAHIYGTVTGWQRTYVTDHELLSGQEFGDKGSKREVESYRVHPNDLRRLKPGEGFISIKTTDIEAEKILFRKVIE